MKRMITIFFCSDVGAQNVEMSPRLLQKLKISMNWS